jgi:hypothetical protein
VNVSENLHSRQIKDCFVAKNELRDKKMPEYISDNDLYPIETLLAGQKDGWRSETLNTFPKSQD